MPEARAVEGGFGLYVHWPFCLAKCPYCDFNSHVRETVEEACWREALCTELETLAAKLAWRPALETIFFGGGTPSLMSPETVGAVIATARRLFPVSAAIEITLEANPTSSEAARFRGFREAGVNRLSVGVQALDDAALRFLGRKHDAREAIAALELARAVFPRLSFDLIYARPDQSAAAWRAELKQALGLAGDHLSFYQLTIEPETKFGALHAMGALAPLSDERAADLFSLTQKIAEENGFPAYEISNHARPGSESRHNLIYWRGGGWIGIGPGAHGRWPAPNEARIATESERLPERWLASVRAAGHGLTKEAPLTPQERAEEILLMGLRLSEGVDLERIERHNPHALDEARLARLIEDGFLRCDGARLAVTPHGRSVLNRLIAEIAA